jgi:thiamine biosynthesis lipoprotein ApbE
MAEERTSIEVGARLIRVEQIMGTAISIDVRSPLVAPEAIDRVFAYLRDVDARFSPFRHASEVNRLGRGEIALSSLSLDVRQVLSLCEELRASTWRSSRLQASSCSSPRLSRFSSLSGR